MNQPNIAFDFGLIEMAFEYANLDDRSNEAYLDRYTGTSLYFSFSGDSDERPEDLDDSSRYIQIPDTRDFELGSQLAFDFANEIAPNLKKEIHRAFEGRGAYRRFKDLLERHDLLDSWYNYEADKETAAIIKWCEANNILYK